uniref:40S ribosomal protein S29 n=1 Tax=Erpetoichthys calabaricus TaxID=27687 RepID=A0A8C4RZE6_ERPCA
MCRQCFRLYAKDIGFVKFVTICNWNGLLFSSATVLFS